MFGLESISSIIVQTSFGLGLSIIAFVLFLSKDAFGFFSDNIDPALTSFFVFIIMMLVTERIASALHMKRVEQSLNRLPKDLSAEGTFFIVGRPLAAKQFVMAQIDQIRAIDNTHSNFSLESSQVEPLFYSDGQYARFKKLILSAVNQKKVVWRDLISKNSVDHLREIIKNKAERPNCSYQARFICEAERVNFLIAKYKDGREILFIGWDYGPRLNEPTVVAVTDPRVVGTFAQHYEILWQHDSQPLPYEDFAVENRTRRPSGPLPPAQTPLDEKE